MFILFKPQNCKIISILSALLYLAYFFLFSFYFLSSKSQTRQQTRPFSSVSNYSSFELTQLNGSNEGYKLDLRLTNKSAVLVTGGAGFIGFSVCKALAQLNVKKIVVLDTFNDYYSVKLKRQRAEILQSELDIVVVEGDVCDSPLLADLYSQHKFSHILHLAAQAGVRYSMKKPLVYIKENMKCFISLLELFKSLKVKNDSINADSTIKNEIYDLPHFVYASSSSVYGLNEEVPFKESDPVDKQANLYGFTKRSNELMASAYFNLYGIRSIGLRFFTVYGPWGRPDMSPFLFTDKIWKGEVLTVFNNGQMKRDFTYIDDIVDGILRSMQFATLTPQVFNLGNNQPEDVMKLLQLIEKRLGRKAQIEYKNSKSEMPITFASIDKANLLLGFTPKTSLADGFNQFLDWFLIYNNYSTYCASGCTAPNEICVKSSYDDAINKSKSMSEYCDIVVYTVVINERVHWLNKPKHNLQGKDKRSCYFAFVSYPSPLVENYLSKFDVWNIIPIMKADHLSLRKYSQIPKHSPTLFFHSNVKYAIYINAKLELTIDPIRLVEFMSDPHSANSQTVALLNVRHKTKDYSLNNELNFINGNTKANWSIVQQIERYNREAAEKNISYSNYIDTGLMVHNLRSEVAHRFGCKWFNEYLMGGDLDQLAFAYMLASEANRLGEKLEPEQEWCPIGLNASNEKEYVRIMSRNNHWELGSSLASFPSHQS